MNLFSRHKKFEEQLSEQLGDMEVKPSTSLWDRIDSNIANDSFETGMQDSLENFEQMPYPETWDKIAAELPEVKVSNGLAKYYIVAAFAVLFATGMYVGNKLGLSEEKGGSGQGLVVSEEKGGSDQGLVISEEKGGSDQRLVVSERQRGESVPSDREMAKVQDRVKSKTLVEQNQANHNPVVPTKPSESSNTIIAENKGVSKLSSTKKMATSNILVSNAEVASERAAEHKNDNNPISTPVLALAATKATANGTTPPPTRNDNTLAKGNEAASPNKENIPPIVENNNNTTSAQTDAASQLETGKQEVEKPREVAETKPDSAALMQHVQALNEKSTNDVFTRFSLSVYAGANLCYTTYNNPKEETALSFDKNIELRKQLERPEVDWSGGFLLDYRFNKKWMVSAGLMMVNFTQKFDYNIEQAQKPYNANEIGVAAANPNDSFVIGNQYSNRIKYSWNEIPVYINYTIMSRKRWNIDMQAGASYAFINTVDGGMISYDNKGVLVLKGKESFPNIKNTVFLTAMPQVSYAFGSSVSLGIVPTVKYSVTSIIGNERWIQQHPYFIGMNICLRKRF